MTTAPPDNRKRIDLAVKTLAATVVLSLLGDALLRGTPWGVGFSLYALVIVGACAYLHRYREQSFAKGIGWLVPPILLFSSCFAWRDAEALRGLNAICVVLLVGLTVLRRHAGQFTIASVTDYPFRLLGRWIQFISDIFPLLNLEGKWSVLRTARGGNQITATLRGLLLAVPLVLVFGGLFASADASFESLVNRAFQFNVEDSFGHLLTFSVCLWLVGGFLRRMFLAVDAPPTGTPREPGKVGITEIGIVLGSLNLLFAAFVAMQFRHFFGGAEVVRDTADLALSHYARRGFFELATVAFLTLTLLITSYAVLRKEGGAERLFRGLAAGLVILVFIVMQSAVMRMNLYVASYGTTQLRLYVLASIGWIAAVFLWFSVTTLRGRSERFAFGALVLFLAGVFGLNVANPDAMVARTNLARPDRLDTYYLGHLSADATPVLVEALPKLSKEAREDVEMGLARSREARGVDGWQGWNWGREEANRSLANVTLPNVGYTIWPREGIVE